MNKLTIYQVDAFTNHVFGGNPAAVCILNYWLASDLMQKIASENNLSETAFLVKEKDQYQMVYPNYRGRSLWSCYFIFRPYFIRVWV